jgi:hypothetical protein
MFRLLLSAVTGAKPLEWAALGLAVTLALGAAFGAGYALASNKAIKTVATVATNAGGKAAAAQSDHDKEKHKAATKKSSEVKADDAKAEAKLAEVLAKLDALPRDPQKSCDVPQDVIYLLNEAGK